MTLNHKKITNFKEHQILEFEKESLEFVKILLEKSPKNTKRLESMKNTFAMQKNISTLRNRELIVVAKKYNIDLPVDLQNLLKKRSVRTISGVSPIAILTKPFYCPGKCIYCPTEDRMPKSYISTQPAASRSLRNNFDPYDQVKNRVISLEESGHPASKLEIIVMGGTWSFLPKKYQEWYIYNIYNSANSFDNNKTRKKPTIFIDFDGVITDSFEFVFSKGVKAFGEYGINLTKDIFKTIFRSPNIVQEVLRYGSKEISERYTELEKEGYAKNVLVFPDVIKSLQTVSQYFDLVILSANQRPVILQVLKKYNLESLFKNIISRDDNIGSKSEKMINYAKDNSIDLSKTYFIGDTVSDIKEGKKAEVKIVAASWGKIFSYEELENESPYMVINKMRDFEIYLNINEDNVLESGKNGELVSLEKIDNNKNILDQELDIKKVQKINETSSHKVIGLTLETRPDFITKDELIRMRKYGCTRIEIGVQTLDDEVQIFTKRGHLRKHVIKAMRLMKDFGFKVCFHLMPGLPSSTIEKDLNMMKEVFENPNFRPDFIKIYPCMVLPNTGLSKIWEKGGFKPLSDEELVKLLLKFYAFVPEWTRVMRLMRDIPATSVLDGAKFSNLRQILESQPKKLKEIVGIDFYEKYILGKNKLFKDIRSKEIGFSNKGYKNSDIKLKRRDYEASKGKEVFLSFESEDEKVLFALLRLRKPSGEHAKEFSNVLENAGLIREVHSYGSEVAVGNKDDNTQHKGLGKKLLIEAESIVKEEWGFNKISIIAGIGTREYYRKFGYEELNGYMFKEL